MEHDYFYFECQCSDYEHVFRFALDPKDGEVWLDVNLNHCLPWYKRVWIALRYVFKKTEAYGHYDITMLRDDDYKRLHDLLDRSSSIKQQLDVPEGPQEKTVLKG